MLNPFISEDLISSYNPEAFERKARAETFCCRSEMPVEKLKINKRKQFSSMNKTNKLAFFTQNNFSVDNNFDIFPSLPQHLLDSPIHTRYYFQISPLVSPSTGAAQCVIKKLFRV